MASGDSVRDLLVQLRLDQSQYKREMTSAKSELKLLQAEFKAVDSDTELDNAGKTLRENVKSRIALLEGQVTETEKQIEKLRAALGTVEKGSKEESALTKDLTAMETAAANAKADINELKEALNEMDADALLEKIEPVTQLFQDLNMAYGGLVGDWAKETADSADEINVAREQALAMVDKIAGGRPGYYDGWMADTDAFIKQLILDVPATYEEVAEVMQNALQAGGVELADIREFTENFIRLEKSTNLSGEEGAEQFGKFMHVMEVGAEEIEGLGSALVALGNTMPTKEAQIVDTAMRSASALRAVGMTAEDVLGISASALSLGMEPAAAASALEKLAKKAGGSAEFAAKGYGDFREQVERALGPIGSLYDLQVKMDTDSSVRKGLLGQLGMTGEDFDRLMDSAIQAEKVAGLMGKTVEEFAAAWAEDPAKYFASIFAVIGQLDESGAANMFDILAQLGITEIREGRLAANFATISEGMTQTLTLARDANAEATALANESDRLFATTLSRRIMNQNARENMLQAIGEGVKEVRQPWDDFFADLQKNLNENLPEWATTGFGAMVEVLSGFGSILGGVGDVAQSIYYTGQVYKDIKKIDWKNMGNTAKSFGKGALAVGGAAAVVAGLAVLGDALYQMSNDASEIVKNLDNIQISVDEESKNKALAALEEVKNAANFGEEERKNYENIVKVVETGYGDEELFGQAVGYRINEYEAARRSLAMEYGTQIADINAQIVQAVGEGNQALADELKGRRESLERLYAESTAALASEYTANIKRLVDGMLQTSEGAKAALDSMSGLIADVEGALGVIKFNELYGWQTSPSANNNAKDAMAKLMPQIEAVLEDQVVTTMLSILSESGALGLLKYGEVDVSGPMGTLLDVVALFGAVRKAQQSGDDSIINIARNLDNWDAERSAYTDADWEALQKKITQSMEEMVRGILGKEGAFAVPLGVGVGSAAAQGLRDSKGEMVGAFGETLAALQAEADRMAPHIDAVVTWHVQGSAGAGATAGAAAGGIAGGITNNFNVTGSALGDRNNVKKLAQEIMRMQKQTNGSVGKA